MVSVVATVGCMAANLHLLLVCDKLRLMFGHFDKSANVHYPSIFKRDGRETK